MKKFYYCGIVSEVTKRRFSERGIDMVCLNLGTPVEKKLMSAEVKEKLRKEHSLLNPLMMKREIEKRLRAVYDVQKRYGKSKF